MKHLASVSWIGFIVAEVLMVGWAFVWPLTVDDNPAGSILRIGCGAHRDTGELGDLLAGQKLPG